MADAKKRLKVLKAMRKQPHRYNRLRTLGIGVSLAILLAVPLTGFNRIDLWQGHHYIFFRPTTFKVALAGWIIWYSAMYVVTFLSNVVAGRMFCGWGCPVGQISRFGEDLDTPAFKERQRRLATLKHIGFGFLFVLSLVAWWVDLRVLWQGSPKAMAWTWGVLLVGTAAAYAHGRWWRWEFCKTVCPIGLYYTFMAPATWYGIYFRNAEETCIECNACDNVCPVDLAPRELMKPIEARGGFSIDAAPGLNHCLECGDCARACEWIIGVKGREPVPLLMGWYRGPQSIDPTAEAGTDAGNATEMVLNHPQSS